MPPRRTSGRSLLWLLRLSAQHAKAPLLLSATEQLVRALIPSAQAIALGGLVSILASPAPSARALLPWALLLLAGYLAQQSFILTSFKEFWYQRALQTALDQPVLRKVSNLGLATFDDPEVRDLIDRVGLPSGRTQQHLENLLRTAGGWLELLALAVVIGRAVWWLGPVVVAASALLTRLETAIGRRIREFERTLSVEVREAGYAAGLLTGRGSARELRLFGLSRHLIARWQQRNAHIQRTRFRHDARITGRVALGSNLPQAALLLGGMLAIASGLHARHAGPAPFAAALSALLSLFGALGTIQWSARQIAEDNAYLDEVRQLLALPEPDRRGERPFPTMQSGVAFRDVSFTYPGSSAPALNSVTLHIRPGERVALVGANGAGKSTLVKLLLGLYQPSSGCITVEGIDLCEIAPESRQQAMSAVFQDFAQFALTARENIGLGHVDRLNDQAAIERAARQAGAAAFIEALSAGYETPLGRLVEGSHEPSGGQWQRLVLSRGLMRDAPLLILDEPTAALDPLAEVAVYRHFAGLLCGRTAVLVTHRLGSAKICDRIVVLDHGRVAETGTHAELLAAGGLYARMYNEQAAWYGEAAS